MSWSLSAAGHAAGQAAVDAGESVAKAVVDAEQKLVAELKAVLSKPEYGAYSATLSGASGTHTLHQATGEAAPTPPAADSSSGTASASS